MKIEWRFKRDIWPGFQKRSDAMDRLLWKQPPERQKLPTRRQNGRIVQSLASVEGLPFVWQK